MISKGTLRLKTDKVAKLFGGMYGRIYEISNKNAAKELTTKIILFTNFSFFILVF